MQVLESVGRAVAPMLLLPFVLTLEACSGSSDSNPVTAESGEFRRSFVAVDTVTPEQTERHLVARISDFEFSPGSGFLVLDMSEADLKVYRRDGTLERVIGQKGSGPGEFEAPLRVETGPDGNIHVHDNDLNRIQVFNEAGELVRDVNLVGKLTWVRDFLVRPDSRYLFLDFSEEERVLVTADSSGRVLSRHLSIRNVIPEEETDAGPNEQVWKYPRHFTMDAAGDTIYVLATLDNEIWRVVFPGPEVESKEVMFDGYLPPTTPPEERNIRTGYEMMEWFKSRHLSAYVQAGAGFIIWPFIQGEWPRGNPTYLVGRGGWDGTWKAMSGDTLPKIVDVAEDTIVGVTNPATDRMKFILYTLAGQADG